MTEPSAPADGGKDESRSAAGTTDLTGYQQADILKMARVPLLGPDDESFWHSAPDGVVVISQTCDVAQSSKETIQVAPLVRRAGQGYGRASKGAMPSLVPVPGAGDDMYADLEHVATVHKAHVASLTPQRGVSTTQEARKFGARVGRRYARFAFPDEVAYWLDPLKDLVIGRVDKPNSSMGMVLEHVESLRLECTSDWDGGAPYSLTLLVLIKPEAWPWLQDEKIAPEANLRAATHDDSGLIRLKPAEVADALMNPRHWQDRHARAWLWDAFAESLAAFCRPRATAPLVVQAAVDGGAFDSEVSTTEVVTYDRILRSEEIDVEHLSPPLPR